MLLLSLDFAFSLNNFTLFDCDKKEVKLIFGENSGRKSLEIFPAVFETLGVDPRSVEAFAVNLGVGYSTGLRIAVSMAKTYAQISSKPLITYTSCEALLSFLPLKGTYLVLFKVSRYLVGGVWRKDNNLPEGIEYPIILNGENFERITAEVDGIVMPHSVEEAFRNTFKVDGVKVITLKNEVLSLGGAFISCEKLKKGLLSDPIKTEPLYFRPPV